MPTDFTTGLFAITVVLKLKGPAGVESVEPFCSDVDSAGPGLKLNDPFVGLRWSRLPDSNEKLWEKVSRSGDKASRSTVTLGFANAL